MTLVSRQTGLLHPEYGRKHKLASKDPFLWKFDALVWWVGRGLSGIIEAVTGTGKTLLDLAALTESVRLWRPSVVLTCECTGSTWVKRFHRGTVRGKPERCEQGGRRVHIARARKIRCEVRFRTVSGGFP